MSEKAGIDFGSLMHEAMRGLIRKVLAQVAETGLPGEHHFFITFATAEPGVELADWLRERFPDTMTIVMQHWFADLEAGEKGFGITLNFNDTPEHMFIPYDAIRTFVDPSVEFGLKFESQEEAPGAGAHPPPKEAPPPAPVAERASGQEAAENGEKPATDADVVSLDAFRK